MAASHLAVDQTVDVREENGRIVIEPVRVDEVVTLITGITPDNLHGAVNMGPAVGKEAF